MLENVVWDTATSDSSVGDLGPEGVLKVEMSSKWERRGILGKG